VRVRTFGIGDNQDAALRTLADLIRSGQENPRVVALARKIANDCESRDDLCELQAIYDAVRDGNPLVQELAQGLKYRSDPKSIDFFTSAPRLLSMCGAGACGADCDEHTVLVGSLAGALGFQVGARAYGREKEQSAPYVHVYAVALIPKNSIPKGYDAIGLAGLGYTGPDLPVGKEVGLDTTMQKSLGWQPHPGHYRTAWVINEE
jgi:hypothetical protein